MELTLDEKARKQAASEIAKLREPFSLSCLSYHQSAVGRFTDGTLLICKAESKSGTEDKINHFTIGSPP